MRAEFYPLTVPASVAIGAVFPCAQFREKWVHVHGTFVASMDIEGSMDDTNWFKVQTAVSTPSAVQVSPTIKSLRINVTAYTSGTPAAHFGGFLARAD